MCLSYHRRRAAGRPRAGRPGTQPAVRAGPGAVLPRLVNRDAVEGFQAGNVVILLPVGGQFAGADGGHVQQLLDHPAQGEFDFLGRSGAAVPGTDLFHFGVEDVHGVAAQGDDRRVHRARLAILFKGAGRTLHNAARLRQRLGLFLRRGQPDGLERQQLDAVELADGGVEVVGEGQVDRDQRLGRGRPHPGQLRGFDARIRAAAADHDVRSGDGDGKRLLVQRGAAAGCDESGGAAGGGKNGDVGAAAFAQQGHRGAGVGARAEDDRLLGGPVGTL